MFQSFHKLDGPDVFASLINFFSPLCPLLILFLPIFSSLCSISRLFFDVSVSSQRVNHSQEELYPPPGSLRPDERMQQHYQQDYQHRDLDYQHRDLDYQRGPPGGKRKENLR